MPERDQREPTTGARDTWRRLRPLVPQVRRRTATIGVTSAIGGILEAGLILAVVNLALALTDGDERVVAELPLVDLQLSFGSAVAVALVFAFLRLAMHALAAHAAASMSADALSGICATLMGAMLAAPWAVQADDREGHFQEVATNQARRVAKATLAYGLGLSAGLSFAALLAVAVVIEPPAALAMVVVGAGLFLALRPVSALARRQSAAEATASVTYAHSVAEASRLGAEVRLFGVAEPVNRRVDRLLDGLARLHYRSVALSRLVPVVYQSSAMILIVLGLWAVYLSGTARVSVLGTLVLILVRALTYAQSGQSYLHELAREGPYVEAVVATAARYDQPAPKGTVPIRPIRAVTLRNVSYSYGRGEEVLSDLSLEAHAGELVGIVGRSGAGKTTLTEILVRLRVPAGGAYLVDGRPATMIDGAAWTDEVAAVPQTPKLIDGTISENIRFHRPDLDQDRIVAAARAANVHDEVVAWPDGYDTAVGDRADGVSGGQAQRLCLARALAGDPSMLVLDEPTSAVDDRSEKLIRDALIRLGTDTLVFIVAHRPSTIEICDRVLRLESGRLIEAAGDRVSP